MSTQDPNNVEIKNIPKINTEQIEIIISDSFHEEIDNNTKNSIELMQMKGKKIK